MTHISQTELSEQVQDAKNLVAVGSLYKHYKAGDVYKVLELAVQELDNKICVVYQAQYGKKLIFTRLLTSWIEHVDSTKGIVPRFTKA